MLKLSRSPGEVLILVDEGQTYEIRLIMVECLPGGSVRLGIDGPPEVMARLEQLPLSTVEPPAPAAHKPRVEVPAQTQSGRPRLGLSRK